MNYSPVDTKRGGDIPNRTPTSPKLDSSGSIKQDPFTAKCLTISPSIPHPGPYSISDDIPLQLSHSSDDREHGLADGCGRIQSLLVADKPDAEALELLQREDKVLD
jgi:hypothetical protein